MAAFSWLLMSSKTLFKIPTNSGKSLRTPRESSIVYSVDAEILVFSNPDRAISWVIVIRGIEPWIYERTNGFESDCRHLFCKSFPEYLLSATKTPRLEEQYQPKASLCVLVPLWQSVLRPPP